MSETVQGNQSAESVEDLDSLEPANSAAWHDHGVEHTDRGEYALAAESFGRAAALRPGVPELYVDLGEAFRNLGDGPWAVGCCWTALKLRPDDPEALNTLGLAL